MDSLSIFYADDDEDDLMLFEDAVADAHPQIAAKVRLNLVKDGINLVELMLKEEISNRLVVLDINMPYQTGFELLADIRAQTSLKNATVIMYSTSSDHETIVKSFDQGADFYVSKPYDFNSLKAMVNSLLTENWQNRPTNLSNFVYKEKCNIDTSLTLSLERDA